MKTLTLSAAAVALVLGLGINGASAQISPLYHPWAPLYHPWAPVVPVAPGFHGIHTHMGNVVVHEGRVDAIHPEGRAYR